jgi:hypothetical protein
MTHTLAGPATTTPTGTTATTTRTGAALGLASVVLLMAGFALVAPAGAVHTNPAEEIVGFYSDGSQTARYAGGLVESVGLLLFLPFAAMLAARLRGTGVAGDVLGPAARMAATGYVVLCLAPGMSAGAAALWLGTHGGDASTILALNALRAFSYFVALLALAGFLVAIGIGGLTTTGRLARWMSWSAVVIGAVLAIGVAVAQTGLADIASMLALAWIVAVSIGLLRRPERVNAAAGAR